MSDFVASPAAPVTPPNTTVAAGSFWPAIDVNDYRDVMRVGTTTITDPRIKTALRGAIVTTLRDLADWKATQIAAGHDTLAAVPSENLGTGEQPDTLLMIAWRRAVYSYATADLAETHRDLTATKPGAVKAEEVCLTADDHRRNALHAVRDILDVGRTAVELI